MQKRLTPSGSSVHEGPSAHRPLCRLAAAAFIATLTFLLQAAPAPAEDDLVAHLAEGKKTFERICGSCHGIDKPNTVEMDRPAWAALVEQMEERGAKMTAEEREIILDYLGIRNVFFSKCTACHTTERIFGGFRAFEDWKATVEKMSAKSPEGMKEGEIRSITAYLTVILGASPAKK